MKVTLTLDVETNLTMDEIKTIFKEEQASFTSLVEDELLMILEEREEDASSMNDEDEDEEGDDDFDDMNTPSSYIRVKNLQTEVE